mmetsp:Transcript_36086/g.90097  ORF Transcript_36086/g.90097 Transcript_36086/m.90097 type:complete len:1158 (+) Transcript_36086:81-3554(+)
MGVPAFFKWLSTKYPKIVVDVLEEHQQWLEGQRVPVDTSQPNPNGIEFDNLFLDMNGIIHPASHPEDRPAPKTEDDMYLCIAEYLERVFACARPRKLLFMAIDGVAPRAKMNQQRSRRFKSDQERREAKRVEEDVRAEWEAEGRELPPRSEGFDSNVITPGTPFMDRLADFLKAFICYKQSTDEGWRHLRVILSDASVPGEGEHKIMEYIRQQRAQPGYDPNTHHCLHGLDADLIMLALATHEPFFTILREYVGKGNRAPPKQGAESLEAKIAEAKRGEFGELQTSGGGAASGAPPPTPFQFLHVHVLREYLFKEFTESRFCSPEVFDFERLIDDFIFLCFFIGNDFLPHMPSLEIREGAIDTLLDVYKGLFTRPGGGFMCEGAKVDLKRVRMLCVEVSQLEEQLLRKRRENEQREEGRKAQRQTETAQRTAEKKHLQLLAETAQTPQQMAMNGGMHAGMKRARSDGGPSLGSSDDSMLSVFNRIKDFMASDSMEDLELPASMSGFERRMAHQYCDELDLEHPTIGSEPNRRIVLKKKGGTFAPKDSDFADKLKALMRANNEIENPVDAVELGKDGWRERYYSQKLGANWEAELPAMVTEYVRGLCWVMAYYYDGCPSWHWYYPYHYAPFATDLANVINMEEVPQEFDNGTPFRPLEQLMAVLPPGSSHALPAALGKLMKDENSPLANIYPLTFESDMNGKKFAWQAIVLLPFIDQDALLSVVREFEHTLNAEEIRRNSLGNNLVFVSEQHPLANPLVQLQQELGKAADALEDAVAEGEGVVSGSAGGRRVMLTMKLSRGMGGAMSALAEAPPIGASYPVPEFRGERADEALKPFETRATYGVYHLPPRVVHMPQLLPGVETPRPVLATFDRPQAPRFMQARRQHSGGGGQGYAPRPSGQHGGFPQQGGQGYAPRHPPPGGFPQQPPRPQQPPFGGIQQQTPFSAAQTWLAHQAAAANGLGRPQQPPQQQYQQQPPFGQQQYGCNYGGPPSGPPPGCGYGHPPPCTCGYGRPAAPSYSIPPPRGGAGVPQCSYGAPSAPPQCTYNSLPPPRAPPGGAQCAYASGAPQHPGACSYGGAAYGGAAAYGSMGGPQQVGLGLSGAYGGCGAPPGGAPWPAPLASGGGYGAPAGYLPPGHRPASSGANLAAAALLREQLLKK